MNSLPDLDPMAMSTLIAQMHDLVHAMSEDQPDGIGISLTAASLSTFSGTSSWFGMPKDIIRSASSGVKGACVPVEEMLETLDPYEDSGGEAYSDGDTSVDVIDSVGDIMFEDIVESRGMLRA